MVCEEECRECLREKNTYSCINFLYEVSHACIRWLSSIWGSASIACVWREAWVWYLCAQQYKCNGCGWESCSAVFVLCSADGYFWYYVCYLSVVWVLMVLPCAQCHHWGCIECMCSTAKIPVCSEWPPLRCLRCCCVCCAWGLCGRDGFVFWHCPHHHRRTQWRSKRNLLHVFPTRRYARLR